MGYNQYIQGRKVQETNTEKARILGTELREKSLCAKEVEATSQNQLTAEERKKDLLFMSGSQCSQAGHKLTTVKGKKKFQNQSSLI